MSRPDRFERSLKSLPPAHSRGLAALYAYHRHLTQALAPGPAGTAMQSEVLRLTMEQEALFAGRTVAPAMEPLRATIGEFALPRGPFVDMLDGAAMPALRPVHRDRVQFDQYLGKTGGAPAVLVAMVLGVPHDLARVHAPAVGRAWALAAILDDLAAHLARGICLLPADAMAARGARPGDPSTAGAMAHVVAELARQGAALPPIPPDAAAAITDPGCRRWMDGQLREVADRLAAIADHPERCVAPPQQPWWRRMIGRV